MLSIVIPTLNEEKYLAGLLKSIEAQDSWELGGVEVIVADSPRTTDRTKEVAIQYGAKIVNGGLPAYARNVGARVAKGDIVCAIDSDIVLPSNPYFLRDSMREFHDRNLDIAGTTQNPIPTGKRFSLKWPIRNDAFYRAVYHGANKAMIAAQNTRHPLMQVCMFAKREVYDHTPSNGFREDLNFGEDSTFARDAISQGFKFGILQSGGHVLISPRRFEKGGVPFMLKNLYYVAGMKLGHKFLRNDDKINYWDSEGGARE